MLEQKHIKSILFGIITVLPIVLIGGVMLALSKIDILGDTTEYWLESTGLFTFGAITLYLAWSVGYKLGIEYDLYGVSAAQISVFGFLAVLLVINPIEVIEGMRIAFKYIGPIFAGVAIVSAIVFVELFRLLQTHGVKIKMPEGVPTSVSKSFESLIGYFVIIVAMGLIITIKAVVI